jgi:cytochrome oxidase Cu insertion factor (SCO1/SenC/PrrC family)
LIRELLTGALFCCSLYAQPKNRLHDVLDVDKNMKTGPAVSAAIPPFEIVDQNGKLQTFASLRGPKGLFLMFLRSADW